MLHIRGDSAKHLPIAKKIQYLLWCIFSVRLFAITSLKVAMKWRWLTITARDQPLPSLAPSWSFPVRKPTDKFPNSKHHINACHKYEYFWTEFSVFPLRPWLSKWRDVPREFSEPSTGTVILKWYSTGKNMPPPFHTVWTEEKRDW